MQVIAWLGRETLTWLLTNQIDQMTTRHTVKIIHNCSAPTKLCVHSLRDQKNVEKCKTLIDC